LETVNIANSFIAACTTVIAASTIVYTVVTTRLLRQQKNSFVIDMAIRTVQYGWRLAKEREGKETKEEAVNNWVMPYFKGTSAAIKDIDEGLAAEFEKSLDGFIEEAMKWSN